MSFSAIEWLQFFAEGAAGSDGGGEGAESGVDTGDAGRTLEDLGVPADKAERFRKRQGKKAERIAAAPVEPSEEAAPEPEPEPPKMSWDDFMQVPENQQRLQTMMAERGKKATDARDEAMAIMAKLNPALEILSANYGIEMKDGAFDLDAITKAVTSDDSYYERRAEDLGVDVSVAKQLEMANMERKRAEAREQALRQQQEKAERDFQLRQHFQSMQQQAAKLKEIYPDFDLERELQNPAFFERTAPGQKHPMSVEDAFYSIHHDAIMEKQAEAIARKAKADAAANIRSGVRPRENGSAASAAVSATPDIKHMTRGERLAYIKAKYPSG